MNKAFTFSIIFAALVGGAIFTRIAIANDTMSQILENYLAIQNSLAKDLVNDVAQNASAIASLAEKLQDQKLGRAIQASAKALESSDSIETARNYFKKLSASLVSWAKGPRKNNFPFWHRILGLSLNALHKQNLQHIVGYASGFICSDRPNLTPSCAPKREVIFAWALKLPSLRELTPFTARWPKLNGFKDTGTSRIHITESQCPLADKWKSKPEKPVPVTKHFCWRS